MTQISKKMRCAGMYKLQGDKTPVSHYENLRVEYRCKIEEGDYIRGWRFEE